MRNGATSSHQVSRSFGCDTGDGQGDQVDPEQDQR